ncbi:hypothetical protein Tco_0490508 [Tanacetum coccineum]
MVAYLERIMEYMISLAYENSFLHEASFTMLSLYITAKVVGKPVTISEASIRSDLLFDDADGIDSMHNLLYLMHSAMGSVVLEEKESTQKGVSTEVEVSTVKLDEVLKNKAKQKGVEIKDAEDSDRPRATSTRSVLTLKPLPKIDPKDKGKKVLEEEAESDAESEGVDEAERKFDQLAKDEEIARKVQEDWEEEELNYSLNRLLAARLQEEERETFTVEERAKFLYDTIAAQRRSDKDFIAIGSTKDERQIKEMNEESKDLKKKRLKKRVVNETSREEDTVKVPTKQEVTEQGIKKRKSGHVKMIASRRTRPQPDDDSDDEHRKCLRIVTFESTIDSEIMETKSFVSKLHKVSSLDGDYLVVYRVNGHLRAFNYLMEGDFKIMMES